MTSRFDDDITERLRWDQRYTYGHVPLTLEDAAKEIERLRRIEAMAQRVLETFQKDEAQGYRSKDRQFAIELLAKGFELPSHAGQGSP